MRPLQVGDVRITLPGLRPPSKPHGSVLVVATNGIADVYPVALFNRGYQPLALLEEVPPLIYCPPPADVGVAPHVPHQLGAGKPRTSGGTSPPRSRPSRIVPNRPPPRKAPFLGRNSLSP